MKCQVLNHQGFECRERAVGTVPYHGDSECYTSAEAYWVYIWVCKKHARGSKLNEYPKTGVMCKKCDGTGRIWKKIREIIPTHKEFRCLDCHGTGKEPRQHGKGKEKR